MKIHPLYPLMFRTVYKDHPWGGQAISGRFNRANTPHICAESWEVSDVPGCETVVTNGTFEGITLDSLAQTFGRDLIGTSATPDHGFPLLVKLLEVSNDTFPLTLLPASYRKMWYILNAAPDAQHWTGTDANALVATPSTVGDVIDLSGGIAHRLGPGHLVYEVQRRYCTTDATAAVVHPAPAKSYRDLQMRLSTPDFAFATMTLNKERCLHTTEQSFMMLFCTEGKVTLDHEGPHPLTLFAGDLVLIPPKHRISLHPLMPTQLLVTTL